MALTRLEAEERAATIWGDQVESIRPSWTAGEWFVDLRNGSGHTIDGNGHATCHQDCADCETTVCR